MNPKDFLQKLHQNLNVLKERAAKSGDNTPHDLLNQIDDHEQAIALTQQVINDDLTEAEWLAELQPLLVSRPGLDLITVWIMAKYAFDQGLSLGRELGPQVKDSAQEIFEASLDRLSQTPKGELIAAEFARDPLTYEKPVEKELTQLIETDPSFGEQLQTLLAQFQQALKAQIAAGPTYQATQRGRGQVVQGKKATGIQQGDRGQVIIGGSISGDVLGPGATKSGNGGDE